MDRQIAMGTPAQTLQTERLTYPAMLPREICVWRAWLKLYGKEFDRYDYNVRVGKGRDPGPSWPEGMRKMAVQISQLRIDVLAWKLSFPTIIEVEDKVGLTAFGQLVAYARLWKQDNPTAPDPRLMLVAPRIGEDSLYVAQGFGVEVRVVETDFSCLFPKK